MADHPPHDPSHRESHPPSFNSTSVAGTGGWLESESEDNIQTTPQYPPFPIQRSEQQNFARAVDDHLPNTTFDQFDHERSLRTPFNDITTAYATPVSNSGLNAGALPFSPQRSYHHNASDAAVESIDDNNFTLRHSHYTLTQLIGQPYCAPSTPPSRGGLLPDTLGANNAFQNVQPDNDAIDAPYLLGPLLPTQETFDMSAMSAAWQQPFYQTPLPTIHPPRLNFATPATMQQIHQFSSQYSPIPITNRLIQETYTEEDPTRVTSGLQFSTLPSDPTPSRAQGTGSHSGTHLSCDFSGCDKSFDTPSELSHHQRSHTRPEDRPFACEPCQRFFIWEKDLNRHCGTYSHRRKTSSLPAGNASVNFHCPVPECRFYRRGFARRDHYNRHMVTHPGFEL